MHNPNEKEGEKEMKRKAPNRKDKPLFCFKVCNLFNRLPVKMISTVDGVFDYYWCVLKECNIPLVNIGIILVRGAPESNIHETHCGEKCFTTQCQLNTS